MPRSTAFADWHDALAAAFIQRWAIPQDSRKEHGKRRESGGGRRWAREDSGMQHPIRACMKQLNRTLNDWYFLGVAQLSARDERVRLPPRATADQAPRWRPGSPLALTLERWQGSFETRSTATSDWITRGSASRTLRRDPLVGQRHVSPLVPFRKEPARSQ